MSELVDNINNETGGVIAASLNSDGKLVLSNDTGAAISVLDASASASSYDGGSGFYVTAQVYGGFIKLTADDDNPVRIEAGNLHASSPGAAADLARLGFRETSSEVKTDKDAYTITGIALTSAGTTTEWAQTDLTINGVTIYDADITTTSFLKKLITLNLVIFLIMMIT